jgi:hypothetical protein
LRPAKPLKRQQRISKSNMKTIKRIMGTLWPKFGLPKASLAIIAAIAVTASVQAQPASGLRVLQMTNTALAFQGLAGPWDPNGVWNTNAALATAAATNYYIPIQTASTTGDGYGDITVSWGFKQMSGAATDVCKADIQASGNGNDWIDGYYVLSLAANGTTRVFTNATITVNALPYLRLAWVSNATATTMTNITFEVFYKNYRGR